MWTEYSDNFQTFYENFITNINMYGDKRSMTTKGKFPSNIFDISSLPLTSFTSFNCPLGNDTWLPPFVMAGRFFESNGKILLPLSLTVHHAVCDGYHASKFFNEFQNLATNFKQWL